VLEKKVTVGNSRENGTATANKYSKAIEAGAEVEYTHGSDTSMHK